MAKFSNERFNKHSLLNIIVNFRAPFLAAHFLVKKIDLLTNNLVIFVT